MNQNKEQREISGAEAAEAIAAEGVRLFVEAKQTGLCASFADDNSSAASERRQAAHLESQAYGKLAAVDLHRATALIDAERKRCTHDGQLQSCIRLDAAKFLKAREVTTNDQAFQSSHERSDAVQEMKRQRDLLAQAIADAGKAAGIYNGEAPLDGPALLMLLDDMANEMKRLSSSTTSSEIHSGAVTVYAGHLLYEGTRIGVDFQAPVAATQAELDAAFLGALCQQAEVEYLAVGSSDYALPERAGA